MPNGLKLARHPLRPRTGLHAHEHLLSAREESQKLFSPELQPLDDSPALIKPSDVEDALSKVNTIDDGNSSTTPRHVVSSFADLPHR
jgi:hypothetical protein